MGRRNKKITDDALIALYEKFGNVWKVAEHAGMCGQSVHERLSKIGKITKMNVFSEKEKDILRVDYLAYKNAGKLKNLAETMGRTKQFICRQAKYLGLTNPRSPRPFAEKKESNPYARLHNHVRSLRGSPHKCEICGEEDLRKWYDWANLTGDYENPKDYKRMCRKCHRSYDKNRIMRAHLK